MADSWRYDQVSFKASHNSYERDEMPVTTQLRWSSAAKYQAGCRGLELDLQEARNLWLWSIRHLGGYEGDASAQFSAYLRHLSDWSDENSGHDVVTVTLDLKSDPKELRQFPRELDRIIDEFLGADKRFTPMQLRGGYQTLVQGAMATGWPTLGDLRGKFVFCLSGDEKTKGHYARGKSRLCFADKSYRRGDGRPSTASGDRVFFNINATQPWSWDTELKWFANQQGFVTRAYTLNYDELWRKVRDAKANILATDKVKHHEWARIGTAPFRKH